MTKLAEQLAAKGAEAPAAGDTSAVLQGQLEKVSAECAQLRQERDAAKQEAANAATAERERINSIMGSDAAAVRPETAKEFALSTSMTADEATALLAKLPEEQSATGVGSGAQSSIATHFQGASASARVPGQQMPRAGSAEDELEGTYAKRAAARKAARSGGRNG